MVVPRTANRLPVTASVPSRGAEVVKGLAAVVGTILIVVGVPLVLLATVGAPWPSSTPGRGWLSAELTTGALFKILGAVVWLAWAHFVVCLLVELVAERSARGMAPRVPGGGIGTQSIARRLIGAIVLLAGSATMSVSSASAAVAPAADHAPVHRQMSLQQPVISSAVEAPQTESPATAADKVPSTGQLEDATKADVRQQNSGVVTYYDVKPPSNRNYDTLWDIAERYLGDGFRYKEIYELNKGITQPDGQVMKNADLIHPGWVMRMPSDAKGPGLKVVDHAEQEPVAPSSRDAGGAGDEAEQGRAQEGAADPTATGGQAGAEARSEGTQSDWAPVYGVAGGLLAAGLALGLRRRRASLGPAALWALRTARGPGDGPAGGPGDGPPNPGAALRDEAEPATARWLDRGLRSWNSVPSGAPVPAPARCTVSPAGISVAFAAAPERPAPEGWQTSHDGRIWSLAREDDLVNQVTGLSPAPGLVSVGRRDDGSLLLLDLEAIPGVISIGGDPTVARAVAMSLAVDTATHPWADERRVTLVGFADDLSSVGHANIGTVDDLERVLESLENVANFQRSGCRRADTVSARTARARSNDAGQWRYELVVCSGVPSAHLLSRLSDLAADQQVSLAVVLVGDCPEAAARFAVSADGRLTNGILGVDVVAQQLAVPASRALVNMFELPQVRGTLPLDDVAEVLSAETELTAAGGGDAPVRVDLMGPVTVGAPTEAETARRDLLTEIVAYVAVHPQGVHTNLIGAAIWPRGVSDETRDAALEQAQEWLGRTADGTPRLDVESGVWKLHPAEVVVDWDVFRRSLNRASENAHNRESVLRGALALVRGMPWDQIPDDRYSWLANETVEADMQMAVGLTARSVAEAAAQRDDANAARDALLRGLAMVPASEELWCAALRLADRFAGAADVRVVADQMYSAIEAHGSPLGASAQTDALVDELLPGYRSHAA